MDQGRETGAAVLSALADQLHRGERLLWTGEPDPSVLFTGSDVFLVPFSLLWCGFTTFWIHGVVSSGAPVAVVAFGGVFAVIGLYVLVGRFVVKRWTEERIRYAVTDQRALVITGSSSVSDADLRRASVSVRYGRGRRHVTVTVGPGGGWSPAAVYANTGMDVFGMRGPQQFGLYDVADVEGLTRALKTARER